MESNATPELAASKLDERFRGLPWYITTGVGETENGHVLFVYVQRATKTAAKQVGEEWMGYPVVLEAMGKIKSLGL